MKDTLKRLIEDCINSWNEDGIYALSLEVFDSDYEPAVALSYNTEDRCYPVHGEESEDEFLDWKNRLRWDHKNWGNQHEEMWFPDDEDTAEIVKQWIRGLELVCDPDDPQRCEDNYNEIYDAFLVLLADIVKEIHKEKILTKKFGGELPILIYEYDLGYQEGVIELNTMANGETLVTDFAEWIRGINARGIYM